MHVYKYVWLKLFKIHTLNNSRKTYLRSLCMINQDIETVQKNYMLKIILQVIHFLSCQE